jgi:lysophospholipase L1-like esterase
VAAQSDYQFSQASSVRAWLATAGVGLAVLFGSAQGRFEAGLDAPPGLDAVFEMARSTLSILSPDDRVDLHDGRSRVPTRWQAAFERFAASDRVAFPAANGVVFVGSSSIDYWRDLPAQFPTWNVVQRGLGGATIADCTRNLDRLILPYRPRTVVFYAGDNDLAAGVTPERVVADFDALVRDVHRQLPATRIVFVSIKPSPVRAGLMPLIRKTNGLIAAYARTDPRLDFVDIFDAMLDHDARPRRELFVADGLHMTPAGYALWHDALLEHLH